jgi:alpha-glucosidase
MISVEAPLETVPMFVRGGAIIPTAPEMNYTGEKPQDPITFNIYPDDQGSASATLYEDDGISTSYKQAGFRRTTLSVRRVGLGYVVTISAPQGSYNPGSRKFSFVVKGTGRTPRIVTANDSGSEQTIRLN